MIVVLAEVIVLILSGVEKQLSCQHLEGHAGQGPHICAEIVLGAGQDLRASVLPCLDFCGEVMVLPASVTKISNLDLESFFKFWAFVKHKFGVEGREKFS